MQTQGRMLITVVTPFGSDGEVLSDQMAAQIARIIRVGGSGTQPLLPVVNGEAGEMFTLSREERVAMIDAAVAVSGGLPVFAGVTGTSIRTGVSAALDAVGHGASGLYLFPPHGGMGVSVAWDPVHDTGPLLDYAQAIRTSVDVPIIVHPTAPFSSGWGYGWPLTTVERFLDIIPDIAGWKMMYPFEAYHRLLPELRERGVPALATNGLFFHEYLAGEAMDGACTGSWLYAIEPMLAHIAAWEQADHDETKRIWFGGLRELHRYAREDATRIHSRGKLGAWISGLIDATTSREPARPPSRDEVFTLARLMHKAGVPIRPREEIIAYTNSLG